MEAPVLTAVAPRAATKPCAVCGSTECEVFYEVHNVPTQTGILWPTPEAARNAPTTDVRLTFCPHCHYIGNEAYEPAKITHTRNDFSLEFSPSFRAFAQGVAAQLIEQYQLKGGRVVDIGCGDGDFLRTLCRLGMAEGVGIDPGYAPRPGEVVTEPVGFIKDFFGPGTVHEIAGADLISCRHMLDILATGPAPLLRALRQAIPEGEKPLIYVEDPNALYNIGEQVVWNIVNEHSSWMTPGAQAYLFRSCGFEVLDVHTCWHDEYLGLVARPAGQPLADPGSLPPTNDPNTAVAVRAFADAAQAIIAQWQERVDELRRAGKRVVGWAAGSRAISFLNTFDLDETVVAVVDINPRRQGQYIPGTAHPVIGPDELMSYHPDVLLITNPTYVPEIQEQARQMGFAGEFMVL
ncbi:methyltransferase domain-containing protein [Hymenobacter busanensis]|uniref:Methyltransferase domain-containing protein n=1 Tax=Hymenobacter busanensis TaxID=2607656 RepID=A0A7L4ZXN6_9BACT|nr:class I SAM-dependent methyltransferase [Hymenobacter busanensis]KAA9339246.1 methyltransferase domain-containing protein [Hymenobacter busanensis]QHJ06992.1 methyltransferase domain-containing protein [Hymenobacter busanensis]